MANFLEELARKIREKAKRETQKLAQNAKAGTQVVKEKTGGLLRAYGDELKREKATIKGFFKRGEVPKMPEHSEFDKPVPTGQRNFLGAGVGLRDINREVGLTTRRFLAKMGTETRRGAVGLAFNAQEKINEQVKKKTGKEPTGFFPTKYQPKTDFAKLLLGETEVKTATEQGKELLAGAGISPEKQQKFGPATGLAVAGLSLIPESAPAAQAAIRGIAQATDPAVIKAALKNMGVAAELTEELANKLVAVTKPREVQKIITQATKEKLPFMRPGVAQTDEPFTQAKSQEFALTERGRKQGLREGLSQGRQVAREEAAQLKGRFNEQIKGIFQNIQDNIIDQRVAAQQIKEVKQGIVDYARTNLPLHERGKLLATVKNAKTQEDLTSAVQHMDSLADDALKRETITAVKNELKHTKPRTVGGIPRGTFTAPVQQKLDTARAYFKMPPDEAQAQIMANIQAAPDGVLSPDKIAENELLGLALLKRGDSKQAQSALETLQTLKAEGKTKYELQAFNRQTEYQRTAEATSQEILGGKKLLPAEEKKARLGIRATLAKADSWLHGFETLMERLSRSPATRQFTGPLAKIADSVKNSRRIQIEGMRFQTQVLQDNFNRIFKVAKNRDKIRVINANRTPVNLGSITKGNGTKIDNWELTQNQMYKKWMEWQDETLRPTFEANGWTPAMMKKIENAMTPEIKSWADWQLREFYPKYGEGVAPLYETRFGTPFPRRQNYSPIRRTDIELSADQSLLEDAFHYVGATPSALKARVGSLKPLDDVDGDEVLMQHVVSMEHFKAFEDTVRMLRSTFGNPTVKNSLEQVYGRGLQATIGKLVDNIARDGHDTSQAIGALDKLRVNFTRAKLGASPLQVLKQMAAIPAYITEMPNSSATAWAKGAVGFWKNPVENARTLMKSPIMQSRYDVGSLERDIKLAMRSQQVKQMLTGKENFLDRLMLPIRLGDQLAVVQGGWPVYKATLDQQLAKGVSKVTAESRALRAFERATERSQQAGNIEDLSRIQTSGGSLGRLFSMFLTAPQQYYRIASRSMHGLMYSRGSKASNAKNLAITWVVLPSLFQYVADGFEYREERQARAMILGPLNGIPAMGNAIDSVVRAATGDDVFPSGGPGPFSTPENLVRAIQRIRKEDVTNEDVMKSLDDLGTLAGDLTGVPYGPISQMAQGATGLATGATTDPRRLLYSKYSLKAEDTDTDQEIKEVREAHEPQSEGGFLGFFRHKPEAPTDDMQSVIKKSIDEGMKSGKTGEEIKKSTKQKAKTFLLNQQKPALTKEEKKIQSLSVENGARSDYVQRQMKKTDDYTTLLDDYADKGILTSDVLNQLPLAPAEIIRLAIKIGMRNGDSQETIKNDVRRHLRALALTPGGFDSGK